MKPRLLITIGDPNGIGPETVLKTLKNRAITKKYDLTVIAPLEVLAYYSRLFKYKLNADNFNIIPLETGKFKIQPGVISAEAGFISGLAIKTAIELCVIGEYEAIVTAPINKRSLNLGGFKFTGHTEMLTTLSGAKDSCMVMLSDVLNMAFVTTHPPVKNIASLITKKRLASKKYRNFEMTLAMYHDQGFIPFKMLAGHKGTNFTAGLSFVRTSPDHGTAFDIAGRGIASEVSLVEAIKWAVRLCRNRTKNLKRI